MRLEEQTRDDILGIRREFLEFSGDHEWIVMHGHTPVRDPDFRSNRINIDTGAYTTHLKFHPGPSRCSLFQQGPRDVFVDCVSVYTEMLSISSRARSCSSLGIVNIGNVEAVCGTRHVLRTIVASSSRSVWKLWTGVPSSSCFELAFFSAAVERLAGATG